MNSPTASVPADDRELVARFLEARDEASFRALYRAHTPALLLFARRLLGRSADDAEDAVQEAWVRAVRRLDGFRWDSSLRTWLAGITLNCCREALRGRRPPDSPEGLARLENEPVSQLESVPDLEVFVRSLPDGCREVLVLHDIEGYTHSEISAALGIAIGTSKSQLSRARQTIRAWLDADAAERRKP